MSAAPSVFVFRRIRTRLAAGFGLVLGIAIIMGGAAVWWLERLGEQNQYLSHNAQGLALAQKWASGVRTNLDRSMTATRLEAAVADDTALQSKLTPLRTQLTQEMAESAIESSALQEKLAQFDADTPLRDLVQNVVSRRQQFVKLRGEIRDDLQMGDGTQRIDTDLVRAASTMIDALNSLRDHLQHRNEEATQVIATEIKNSQTAILLLCLAALTVGGVVSAFITRVLVGPVRYSVHAANELAAGNLAVNIEVRGHDETAQLLQSLNDMREAFVAVVTRVRSNAEGLVQASANLSLGNVNLSERTQLETNALDSTAQAIHDLGVTAAQNAENAAQVHNLTQSATKIAQRAGYEVNRVISTMNDINIASNKIGDIVSVIDGIAFQTNLLALNAAVEAARAGEFGRGFAVVASEVRSLAGRSADAAKSIRSLAGANINSAAQGSEVVNHAGDTMQEVVSSFDQVHQLMANITQASQEQNQGVQDVRSAMEHMSQAVAANAEMVQMTSDSASLVAQQADELVQAVSVFQLGDSRTRSHRALTAPPLAITPDGTEQQPSDLAISAA